MIKERSDLHFIFLTKRIERFAECVPDDWNDVELVVLGGELDENARPLDYDWVLAIRSNVSLPISILSFANVEHILLRLGNSTP